MIKLAFARWSAALLASFLCLVALPGAHAQLRIDVTQGHLEPLPIAVPDFLGTSPEEQTFGRDLTRLIRSNLDRSALFRALDPQAFIERAVDLDAEPRFADWRIIKAQALAPGRVEVLPDGRLRVRFALWDVYGEQRLTDLTFATSKDAWRRLGHKIADAIYERLTGEQSYFDTRIVYIAETGPITARVKRLAIMDQDGANPVYLTGGQHIVLTPRFSPSSQEITYMSYEGVRPRVWLLNLETGRQEALGDLPGMSFAPRFSPDGADIAFSLAQNGNTDVYVRNLTSGVTRRLTSGASIDTSPSFSPDGRQVVFTSDRGGSPQLYIVSAQGGEAKRLTFGEGLYSTPVWSPRGDLIAFTKQWNGRFYIGVIRPDGSGERLLTQSYLDEGPTWSPNGRVIVFFRETRPGAGPKLWSVDLTGRNERALPTATDASDPAWSPLLP